MRRPLLINGALLLVAALLAAAVWLSTQQQNREQKVTLTKLTPDQVSEIIIESGGGPATRFEHQADGWIMTQPAEARADQGKIEQLLQITQAISIRRFSAPQKLAEFGLNPPQAVLTLNQTRIEMGTLHPMNQRRYIRAGNLIHLTNDRFYHLLQAPEKTLLQQPKQPPQ
jgi:hypothetical protein